jgi:hypothetical protein
MRKTTVFLLAGLLPSALSLRAAPPLHYLTVGPMLHWNIKDGAFDAFSFGIEASFWRYGQKPQERGGWYIMPEFELPGYGVALGIDFDKHAARLYAEPQVGMILAGASLGGVAEMPWSGKPARLGLQGSLWVHYLAGMDFRYRYLAGDHYQALGFYAKLPVRLSGEVAYLEEQE